MTTEIESQKPDNCSWSEFTLLCRENEEEIKLVDEFVKTGTLVTEHILKYLGGEKADRRIAAACRFFETRDITPSDREIWIRADHDRRLFLLDERKEVLHLISVLFNQCFSTYWQRDDWLHHLRNNFPNQTITQIVAQFEEDNKRLTRAYQNLINELRILRGNTLYELGGDDWAW